MANNLIKEFRNMKLSFFDNYILSVLTNSSKLDFIAPSNCVYSLSSVHSKVNYIVPINSKIAFSLLHVDDFEILHANGSYGDLQNESDVAYYNARAYSDERDSNMNFVIAKKRKTLENLLEKIEKYNG